MGFFDKIGSKITETAKGITDDIKKGIEIKKKKNEILENIDINSLKKICDYYGIGHPSPYYVNDFTGEKTKRTITREHYVDRIIDRLKLTQIEAYFNKNNTKSSKPVKEAKKSEEKVKKEPEIKPPKQKEVTTIRIEKEDEHQNEKVTTITIKKENKFDEILNNIENHFQVFGKIRDESALRDQLNQFLHVSYKDDHIKTEQPNPKGRSDILINNKYLLELKIAKNKGVLRALKGQIDDYKKVYSHVAIILLDVGEMSNTEIEEYISDFKKFGAERTIVKKGVQSKGKSNNTFQILNVRKF